MVSDLVNENANRLRKLRFRFDSNVNNNIILDMICTNLVHIKIMEFYCNSLHSLDPLQAFKHLKSLIIYNKQNIHILSQNRILAIYMKKLEVIAYH